jgi:photosystem II stability/assembly factor-like uncharacterized protein
LNVHILVFLLIFWLIFEKHQRFTMKATLFPTVWCLVVAVADNSSCRRGASQHLLHGWRKIELGGITMKTFSFLFLFSLCVELTFAQSGWFRQSPLPTGNTLLGVFFTDRNTGTAVGKNGTILRTTDGGARWVEQTSGTTSDLYSVFFTDRNTGTAVGKNGTILRTTDGGARWVEQTSGTENDLLGVYFTDAKTGTAVGKNGTILRTTDGGARWTEQTSGTENVLWGVFITDAKTGTAVGKNGTILRTTDGGVHWTEQTSGTTNDLTAVSFTDANNGTAVGYFGTIRRTTNGGVSWTAQSSGTTNNLWGVSFTDANNGTAVGEYGTILRTTTGGVVSVQDDRQSEIPRDFTLLQNYPNPFERTTTIRFTLTPSLSQGERGSARCGRVRVMLKVLNVFGTEVATLVDGAFDAGDHSVVFDTQTLPSGVYFYRLQVGGNIQQRAMVLVR